MCIQIGTAKFMRSYTKTPRAHLPLPRLLPALAIPNVCLADLVQLVAIEDLLVVSAACLVEHEPHEILDNSSSITGPGIDHHIEQVVHVAGHAIRQFFGLRAGVVWLLRGRVTAAVRDADGIVVRALAIQHADLVDDRAFDEWISVHEVRHFVKASLETIVTAQSAGL